MLNIFNAEFLMGLPLLNSAGLIEKIHLPSTAMLSYVTGFEI